MMYHRKRMQYSLPLQLLLLIPNWNDRKSVLSAAFQPVAYSPPPSLRRWGSMRWPRLVRLADPDASKSEWTSDFDDYVGDDAAAELSSDKDLGVPQADKTEPAFVLSPPTKQDLTGCATRQLLLGPDVILDTFIGNMGFEEVTDWEYYYQNLEDPDDRKVVKPNPLTENADATPRRTKVSSGSVVRLFRGELVGTLGGLVGAQGLDRRILIKEFSGTLALALAKAELQSIGKLQSTLLSSQDGDDWNKIAGARSIMARQDNTHVATLLTRLQNAGFLGILGEVNLAELEDEVTPNDFYRALGVAPPKPGAVWLVYEYAGFTTLQAYGRPAQIRRARLPPQRGWFGNTVAPPPLPPWKERANYVVKGVMKKTIQALAVLHDNGIVHRSIGRNSIILSSKSLDKTVATSPFATNVNNLLIKLADFGFSGNYEDATADAEFITRARSFGLSFRKGENSIATTNFAIAEDMHALGFCFLGLLLSALAELPTADAPMPSTDDDTLQRLVGEIFDKDVSELREYMDAEDVWSNLVELLDENDGAGWKVLETLLLAREKAAEKRDTSRLFSVAGLLENPFFKYYHKSW